MVELQTAPVATLERFLDDASIYGKSSTLIRLSTSVPFTGDKI
ncbi:hypothetical protein [Exiguobacterium undae]